MICSSLCLNGFKVIMCNSVEQTVESDRPGPSFLVWPCDFEQIS